MTVTRRTLLAAPFFVRNLISSPPSEQFRLGAFGAGGMTSAARRFHDDNKSVTHHPTVHA